MYQAIIIDDETLFLRHLETNVPWARYRTHIQRAFSSSQLALDYLKANPAIDILFTDIKMPGVNGIELIRALPIAVKQRAFIIALSGYEEYALVREAFLAGASDYLLKVDINTPAFESTMQQMLGFLDSRAKTAAEWMRRRKKTPWKTSNGIFRKICPSPWRFPISPPILASARAI